MARFDSANYAPWHWPACYARLVGGANRKELQMDLATVAAFVSLEVASGFLREHGKEIYQKVKSLLTPEELISLNLLENDPENKELRDEVASALESRLKADSNLRRELEEFFVKFPASVRKQNTITQTGYGNISFQDVQGSKIKLN